MQNVHGKIISHSLEPLGKAAPVIRIPEHISMSAGQFLMTLNPLDTAATRTRLFPIQSTPDGVLFDHIPATSWLPGQQIDVIGPLGRGFTPPVHSTHWLLISLGDHPERLFPLLEEANERSASLAFMSRQALPALPKDVEQPTAADDALLWADFIALEIDGTTWPSDELRLLSAIRNLTKPEGQILLDMATPCGIGGCMGCMLPKQLGGDLGCQVGLVHDLGAFHA